MAASASRPISPSAVRSACAPSFQSRRSGENRRVTLRLSKRIAEIAEPLDPAADAIQGAVKAVPQPVRDLLDGVWLGNPLH
jgi:hypothetical protein